MTVELALIDVNDLDRAERWRRGELPPRGHFGRLRRREEALADLEQGPANST